MGCLVMKRHVAMGIVFITLMYGIMGCAGYGKLRLQTGYGDEIDLEDLKRNWNDYAVYYTETRERDPSAVLFDPRGDERTVEKKGWNRIEDPDRLAEVLGWIEDTKFMPRLHQILGPDGELYGYLFSAWENEVVIRAADERTVRVSVREVPPLFYKGP